MERLESTCMLLIAIGEGVKGCLLYTSTVEGMGAFLIVLYWYLFALR